MKAEGTIAEVLANEARFAVVEADCREVLASLPARSVDHCLCDPPFEIEAHTKQRRALKDATQKRGAANRGDVRRVDSTLPFAAITADEREAVARELGRVVRRWTVAFCQIEAIAAWREALEVGGLEWVRGGIWRKPDGMPQFTGDRPGMGFESLAIAHPKCRKRWNGGGRHAVWTATLEHGHGNGTRNEHPTQKPLAIMLQLVADFTDPGDVVIDPYSGSGSTGVACLRLGRRFIGCDLDAGYVRFARERLRAECNGTTLSAARAGQCALFAEAT